MISLQDFLSLTTAAHGQMERLPLLLLEGQWGVEFREEEVLEPAKRHGWTFTATYPIAPPLTQLLPPP